MRDVSVFSACPVPLEQRPVNEYQELKDAWLFNWVMLDWPLYLKKLAWVWVISWIIFCPAAAASFPPGKSPGEFILGAATGASVVLALVLMRLSLGWYYIKSRLLSRTIFYEESGWYDGQTWLKTPEFLAQDQLIFTYQVQPILTRLQQTFYGLAGLWVLGGLMWFFLLLA